MDCNREPPRNDTWYLHVGFMKTNSANFPYVSVDGKMKISQESHWWFENHLIDLGGLSFTGPSLCFFRKGVQIRPECSPGPMRKCFHMIRWLLTFTSLNTWVYVWLWPWLCEFNKLLWIQQVLHEWTQINKVLLINYPPWKKWKKILNVKMNSWIFYLPPPPRIYD